MRKQWSRLACLALAFMFMTLGSLCLSPALATDDNAIGGRSHFPVNGHTYAIVDLGTSSWEWVNVYCESLGGHLATITSEEENIFLMNLIASEGVKNAYFGLSDEANEGDWKWVTGEQSSYRNWHSGEPNSENSREDYAMFYWKYEDGSWNDGDFGGSTVRGGTTFICEWDYDARTENATSQEPTIPDYDAFLGQRIANMDEYRDGITGECVWYVRGRAQEKLGADTGIFGDAHTWWGKAEKSSKVETGSEIRSNSIACFFGPYASGHVVFVEYVSEDGGVYYTEANVDGGVGDRKISPNDGVLKWKTREEFEGMCNNTLQGYIYLE